MAIEKLFKDEATKEKGERANVSSDLQQFMDDDHYSDYVASSISISNDYLKKILIMRGTRFISVFLSRFLVKEGHQILHLKGDRKDTEFVKASLSTEGFDVVYDINVISFCGHGTTNCLGHVALVTELVKRCCERKTKLKSSWSSNSYNVELF
ncbi:hypothetical protein LOK49_LG13G01368 [Camellia lanceoleosa]|uniref:Uncharacterized protein n=1 Tax=Camellia lanceoleosa TaxID=1840588 RepID=A0ACC0FLK4_9ERIC|nr:hypothetical protein LOK49_LG13G01368 [Camellia lanceoleosa]